MTIDPEKLLALAKDRQRDDGVTLSWPTVLKIVEELRALRSLRDLDEQSLPCRFHGKDTEACAAYSGQVPCDPEDRPGWQLVPKELTEEMRQALYIHPHDSECYRQMLSVAPKPWKVQS